MRTAAASLHCERRCAFKQHHNRTDAVDDAPMFQPGDTKVWNASASVSKDNAAANRWAIPEDALDGVFWRPVQR
jgi:hypothetical protein